MRFLQLAFLSVFLSLPAFAQEVVEDVAVAAEPDLMTLGAAAAAAVVALGLLVSRFTKTDKDDAFFARLGGIFKSLKK